MIRVFTGGVGSGKSYSALCEGLEWVECWSRRLRRYVVANFPVRFRDKDAERRWIFIPNPRPQELVRLSIERGWSKREDSALLIIDEASVIFNARDWQGNKDRLDWIKFFAHSRKLGFSVILITQDLRSLDRQIRNLADVEVKHVSWKGIPWLSLVTRVLRVPIFWRVFYPLRTKFNGMVTVKVLLPWVARRYDTMRLFGVVEGEELEGVQEKSTDSGNIGMAGRPDGRGHGGSPGGRPAVGAEVAGSASGAC